MRIDKNSFFFFKKENILQPGVPLLYLPLIMPFIDLNFLPLTSHIFEIKYSNTFSVYKRVNSAVKQNRFPFS